MLLALALGVSAHGFFALGSFTLGFLALGSIALLVNVALRETGLAVEVTAIFTAYARNFPATVSSQLRQELFLSKPHQLPLPWRRLITISYPQPPGCSLF